MNVQFEYNARSIPPSEVARSFIPPEPHFVRLLSRNHALLVGPRGSGKTTLFKMLTVRALCEWDHPQAANYARQVGFNGAFIPADVAWGGQLDALDGLPLQAPRKEAAFVLHTLRALVHSMRQAVELGRCEHPPHMTHLAAVLPAAREADFVQVAAEALGLSPPLATLLGLEISLETKLNEINRGGSAGGFDVDAFGSSLSVLITAFNALSGNDERRWALLFDELEIAPSRVKQALLSGIRSIDQRVIIKLAIAPYLDDAGLDVTPTSPQVLHDFQTIALTYPNKEDAASFTEALIRDTFRRLGAEISSLNHLFEGPEGTEGFGRRDSPRKKRSLPAEFLSLADKDSSFRQYIDKRRLFSPDYIYSEENIARDVRKVLPIVIARDYYLRRFESNHATVSRSRKSYGLYSGYPSVLELTEGNPRAILTLMGPLIQERIATDPHNLIKPIPSSAQSDAIRRVELLLTSLLQVIPLDIGGYLPGKGLLDFVDHIGRAFQDRLLRKPFSPDYVGTFVLDEHVTGHAVRAVGRALNAGALIHVPYSDSSHDALFRGLRGQRFRISYALAARYRLLLTLGERVSLSRLLAESNTRASAQASLFDTDGPHDQPGE